MMRFRTIVGQFGSRHESDSFTVILSRDTVEFVPEGRPRAVKLATSAELVDSNRPVLHNLCAL